MGAAALSQPVLDVLEAAFGRGAAAAIAQARDAGVVRIDEGRIRLVDPLLASALYTSAPEGRLRALHSRLAVLAVDPEEQARHLALAAVGPDAEVASKLDEAAVLAEARGAPAAAADLAERALSLTPVELVEEVLRRTVVAAEYRHEAGDALRAAHLFDSAVAAAAPGPARARALMMLGQINFDLGKPQLGANLFHAALAETDDDAALRCGLHVNLAWSHIILREDLNIAAESCRGGDRSGRAAR